ncbi:FAD binding domain-containing protein [Mycena sanguinolenta]|uniref:FAD binding domain-containing protein n=1 Tax=Mycena sanguinolenta TaxID=230812 RepID=A0A8H6XVF9_9AGAR|nr:FAD binding domain-containing protein [Mycena sanguinolenta]
MNPAYSAELTTCIYLDLGATRLPMASPEQAYLDMIQSSEKISEDAATEVFDRLRPIPPSFLMGEWEGGDLETGHPLNKGMKTIKWAGKTFRTVDDVDPIVVYGEGRKRTLFKDGGHARIREVNFRGVTSAAMIYDSKPIIDHFRYVDENTVAGMMDTKSWPPGYHFYLTRCRAPSAKM